MTHPSDKTQRTHREQATSQHVGGRVKAIRTGQAMPLHRLEELTGIAEIELVKYETGTRRMSPLVLLDLSKALGVPIGDFFAGL
jgi:transcriptional regulator with XRE-family HTH domain